MKLWLISQDENTNYDTYDSAVVAAETEDEAKAIHPAGDPEDWSESYGTWCKSPDGVKAQYLGETERPAGVVLASFNAG